MASSSSSDSRGPSVGAQGRTYMADDSRRRRRPHPVERKQSAADTETSAGALPGRPQSPVLDVPLRGSDSRNTAIKQANRDQAGANRARGCGPSAFRVKHGQARGCRCHFQHAEADRHSARIPGPRPTRRRSSRRRPLPKDRRITRAPADSSPTRSTTASIRMRTARSIGSRYALGSHDEHTEAFNMKVSCRQLDSPPEPGCRPNSLAYHANSWRVPTRSTDEQRNT